MLECTKGTLHARSSKISNTVPFTFNTHQIFVCDTTITIESFPWDPLDLNNQWFTCKSSICYYIKYDTCTSACNYDIVGVFSRYSDTCNSSSGIRNSSNSSNDNSSSISSGNNGSSIVVVVIVAV